LVGFCQSGIPGRGGRDGNQKGRGVDWETTAHDQRFPIIFELSCWKILVEKQSLKIEKQIELLSGTEFVVIIEKDVKDLERWLIVVTLFNNNHSLSNKFDL
jgi:hypothetical protein